MIIISDDDLQQAYRYAISLTNDHESAKDVVHSAYVSIMEKNSRAESHAISDMRYYFLRCIRNTFIDQKRIDMRWQVVDESHHDNMVDIGMDVLEATSINQSYLAKLWSIFQPLERELLYLWAVEEYTIDEISQLTDIPRGTLLSRVHRIRKKVNAPDMQKELAYEKAY